MNSLNGEEVEMMSKQTNYNDIYEQCKDHMHAYVLAETTDGTQVDGIITGLDEENVYLAIPIGSEEAGMDRQYGYGSGYGSGHGYGSSYGHGGYSPYGYGQGYFNRPQRFRRLVLPLAALAALSILPWY